MEGSGPVPEQKRPESACVPRRHFHFVLPGIVLPILGIPLALLLAIRDSRRWNRTREDRLWINRLFALVGVDVLVAICIVLLYGHREEAAGLAGPAARRSLPPRIGISFDDASPAPRVREVLPDSPAARAGLRSGDIIRAIDGAPVGTFKDVQQAISQSTPGSTRRLEVLRSGQPVAVDVVPETPKPTERSLMAVTTSDAKLPWVKELVWLVPVLLVGGAAQLAARRRKAPRIVVWRAVICALAASATGAVAVLFAAKAVMGGWSIFGVLLSMYGQTGLMLLTSWFFIRALAPTPPPEISPPLLPKFRAALLAILYVAGGYLRLGVLLTAFTTFILKRAPAGDIVGAFAQTRLGVLGVGMLVVDVVLLGPVAEEFLFRGLLVPRLHAQLGPGWALWGSAVLFASLHYRYEMFTLLVLFYGLVLGWARLRTGSLTVPIILHCLINAVALGLSIATGGSR